MIEFYSENKFELSNQDEVIVWLDSVIREEGFSLGELSYIFCNDDYLLNINKEFLRHDTLTDIITFDYNLGKEIHGEIYISTERVRENATQYNVDFMNELSRVLVHGVLHLCGYQDKNEVEEQKMRALEDHYLSKANFLSL